jgi:hypothetical protein
MMDEGEVKREAARRLLRARLNNTVAIAFTTTISNHALLISTPLRSFIDDANHNAMSQASADIPHTDLRPPLKVSGYPKLAQYLSKPSDSEHTGSTFKAFRECSTRNILYIEAEMIELIAQQNIFDREDLLGDRDNKRYARSWPLLVRSRDPRHKQRVKHIKKIRRVLKEYRRLWIDSILHKTGSNECILQMKHLSSNRAYFVSRDRLVRSSKA